MKVGGTRIKNQKTIKKNRKMDLIRKVLSQRQHLKTEKSKPKAIREMKNKLTFYPTKKRLPAGFAKQRIDQNPISLFG